MFDFFPSHVSIMLRMFYAGSRMGMAVGILFACLSPLRNVWRNRRGKSMSADMHRLY
ncbi:hypothetical protein L208DRAFT_1405256 [Tricholoma matsutake]|nr:hypothetical protein L208DRAFT_1405256 [Tricholoma matsutake 945]